MSIGFSLLIYSRFWSQWWTERDYRCWERCSAAFLITVDRFWAYVINRIQRTFSFHPIVCRNLDPWALVDMLAPEPSNTTHVIHTLLALYKNCSGCIYMRTHSPWLQAPLSIEQSLWLQMYLPSELRKPMAFPGESYRFPEYLLVLSPTSFDSFWSLNRGA